MERYERVKKIGEGSFGKALLVRRKNDGRHCVVKEIAIGKMSPKEREESKKEVKVLSQLKHPNIVMYQESFEGMGNLYIVMDYCEGGDLYQKITSQRGVNFNEGQVIDYFVQICLALKHIHDRKILHRDLKSQNIFLTRHGIIKLGDFGIARVLKSTMELARTCIGTPYYLSPEICENRPYNNKSDIWSLGCVLYELCTLKHAFEAGNMKNLVLKIIRGNYPPVPNRYTTELRTLVARCFKRSPIERPSVNKILKYPIIQERIKKFLSPEDIQDEFSHTVLHKEKFGAVRRPAPRPVSEEVKKSNPVAQVYGVSVAKRPVSAANYRKPVVGGAAQMKRPPSAGKRPGGSNEPSRGEEERRREVEARERRRQNLVEKQEREYQEYLKNIHKKRYEKQQADRMHRAREAGWKNLLQSDEDKNKKPQNVIVKQNEPMVKYMPKEQPKFKPEDNKENEKRSDVPAQRPISARDRPFDAYVAAKEARDHRAMGAEAAERARLVEEFKQRKREAADNRARGSYDYRPTPAAQKPAAQEFNAKKVDVNPPRAPVLAAPSIHGRNKEEQAYLQQLENIRRQNYVERKALQNRNQLPDKPPAQVKRFNEEKPPVAAAFDPRFDPEARRQKIAALKAQADQRAVALREELNKRRRDLQGKLEDERKERERQRDEQQKRLQKIDARPIPANRNKIQNKEPKIAAVAVGLETAMNQVAAARLFRSCSEGDLQKMIKKGEEMVHDRKHWDQPNEGIGLAALPLEVTASAMEATSFNDIVLKSKSQMPRPDSAPQRKIWAPVGKTQLLSALENKTLAANTIFPMDSRRDSGATVSLPNAADAKAKPIGETIVLPKKESKDPGQAVVISASSRKANIAIGQTIVLSSAKEGNEETDDKGKKGSVLLSKNVSPDTSSEGAQKSNERDEGEKESCVLKTSQDGGVDNHENDDDIEELTVISDEAVKGKEKPKARAAWGDNRKSHFLIKEENSESKLESEGEGGKPEQCITDEGMEEGNADAMPQEAVNKGSMEDLDDAEPQDTSAENDSFHTPNASLLQTRSKALKTGLYDSPAKILRTVSLPDMAVGDLKNAAKSLLREEHEDEVEQDNEDSNEEAKSIEANEAAGRENEAGSDDKEENEEEEEDEDRSDEEIEDFEQMLDSMRGVLSSADASPPTSTKLKLQRETSSKEDDDADEEERSCSSNASKRSNEDWVSDDDDDDDDDDNDNDGIGGDSAAETVKFSMKEATRIAKRTKARETLFQRIEESRKSLEDELGTDRFVKVYRYIQAMQENEDDDMNIDPSKDGELSELLEGKNEHLYQRILYLVLADAAYFEDNE